MAVRQCRLNPLVLADAEGSVPSPTRCIEVGRRMVTRSDQRRQRGDLTVSDPAFGLPPPGPPGRPPGPPAGGAPGGQAYGIQPVTPGAGPATYAHFRPARANPPPHRRQLLR